MRVIRVFSICLGVLGLTVCALTPAAAAQSFFGYTGLVQIPTADALSQGEWTVGAYGLNLEEGVDTMLYAVTAGVSQGLEVGLVKLNEDDESGETLINAKYRIVAETEKRPAVATGVIDLAGEDETTAYIVMSKSVSPPKKPQYAEITAPRVHIGIAGGDIDGIFLGASAVVGNRLTLMVEYDSRDVNFGARLAISKSIRLHAAVLSGDNVAVGLSFSKFF